MIDRDNLGGLNTPDTAVQEITEKDGRMLFVIPAYFNGNIYYSAAGGLLEQRAVSFDPATGNYISSTPITSSQSYNNKGSGVFISGNGNQNGIVWILNGSGLDAYNAANVSGAPIYTSHPPYRLAISARKTQSSVCQWRRTGKCIIRPTALLSPSIYPEALRQAARLKNMPAW